MKFIDTRTSQRVPLRAVDRWNPARRRFGQAPRNARHPSGRDAHECREHAVTCHQGHRLWDLVHVREHIRDGSKQLCGWDGPVHGARAER